MHTPPINSLHQNKLSNFLNRILLLDQKTLTYKELGELLLKMLAELCGYHDSALWIKKPYENGYFLVACLIKEEIIESYNTVFCDYDPLNPVNIVNKTDVLQKKNVITVRDVMPYQEFERTKYYINFLSKDDYGYEAVMYLRYKEDIIGCLGILKKKNEGDFLEEELSFMDIISYFLSEFTHKHFSVNSLLENMDLYESLSNQSPIGMIVFDLDSPYNIRYINSAALRYTAEFKGDMEIKSAEENFISNHILNDASYSHFGLTKTICSEKKRPYYVNTVPSQALNGNSCMIYVYIVPQNVSVSQMKYSGFEPNNNLTDRQLEIIQCVLQGKSNREIAKELFISVNTVKTHLNNIYKELNVVNRLGLYTKLKNE